MNKQITIFKSNKRKIIEDEEWKVVKNSEYYLNQSNYIKNINDLDIRIKKLLYKMINTKLSSYKQQDKKNNKYDENKFINIGHTMELLNNSNNLCYYCKKDTVIFYDNIRDETKWTLDRLDNDSGHNHDNVEICCLKCNIQRKTMYHERFLFAKEINIIKKE